jgi:hypothetical protein
LSAQDVQPFLQVIWPDRICCQSGNIAASLPVFGAETVCVGINDIPGVALLLVGNVANNHQLESGDTG